MRLLTRTHHYPGRSLHPIKLMCYQNAPPAERVDRGTRGMVFRSCDGSNSTAGHACRFSSAHDSVARDKGRSCKLCLPLQTTQCAASASQRRQCYIVCKQLE
ncbi:hypothetical protein FKP32DRAFT_925223 [Trametes sanguinea]|nr:hypothetical protein FKP32DRAFT_925223 [Trametes sanguinea]